ncbi:hypothetical protein [Actinocorallia populi]|uniref:hypothetical protein n=1 Tax=Actinocorallia populi TaxID=2079200 RepID=UPI000D0916C7|nr:hypothetical protein [Actinocorallia populi]
MSKKTMSLLALSSLLALGAQAAPVQAAATTWKVVNPHADGAFTTSGPLTVKNSAGRTLFTCANVPLIGEMKSQSTTSGQHLGKFTSYHRISCTGAGGEEWAGMLGVMVGPSYFRATGFNAATGTTTVTHSGMTPATPAYMFSQVGAGATCAFFVQSVAGTYSNATSTLKTTTAQTRLGTPEGQEPYCQGMLTEGETIAFDGALKFNPAIKVTATTS